MNTDGPLYIGPEPPPAFPPRDKQAQKRLYELSLMSLFVETLEDEESSRPKKRRAVIVRVRMDWERHVQMLLMEGQFKQYYRMSYRSFEKLLSYVGPDLVVDELQSIRRTGARPISPAERLQLALCYMVGGNYNQIRCHQGISVSHFYQVLWLVLISIILSPALAISFPNTLEGIEVLARGFQNLSDDGLLSGHVGPIDGWLCPIRTPRKNEVGRVRAFFSGHYQRYGLNVLAACDAHCRFTAVSVNNSGGTNDNIALVKWAFLYSIMKRLPLGRYFSGDNAFPNCRYIMTPFTEPQLRTNGRARDAYNFYLSQLCIRIEMAFGLLVSKWRVLKKPLECKFSNAPTVILAACALHNFCINERLGVEGVSCNPDVDLRDTVRQFCPVGRFNRYTDLYSVPVPHEEDRGYVPEDHEA